MDKKSFKLGLIGSPISHSKSPALFNAAYKENKYSYSLVEASNAQEAFNRFINEGFAGVNVTAPFKDDIMKYVDNPSDISAFLGSANTIINKNNKIYSYITDYYGVRNTIEDYMINNNCKIDSALIIGSGGAGKSAALATKNLGIKTIIANRSLDKCQSFVNKLNSYSNGTDAEAISLDNIQIASKECKLIIYSLSLLIPQIDKINLNNNIIFEANYAHPFFNNSQCKDYLSGKYWLYNQAIPAFELFTSIKPDKEAMWKAL